MSPPAPIATTQTAPQTPTALTDAAAPTPEVRSEVPAVDSVGTKPPAGSDQGIQGQGMAGLFKQRLQGSEEARQGFSLVQELELSTASLAAFPVFSKGLAALDELRGKDGRFLVMTGKMGDGFLEALSKNRDFLISRLEARRRLLEKGSGTAREIRKLDRDLKELRWISPTRENAELSFKKLKDLTDNVFPALEEDNVRRAYGIVLGQMEKLPTTKDYLKPVREGLEAAHPDWAALKKDFDLASLRTVVNARVQIAGRSEGAVERGSFLWGLIQNMGHSAATDPDFVILNPASLRDDPFWPHSETFREITKDYEALERELEDPSKYAAALRTFRELDGRDTSAADRAVVNSEKVQQLTIGVGVILGGMAVAEGVGLVLAPYVEDMTAGALILESGKMTAMVATTRALTNTIQGGWGVEAAAFQRHPLAMSVAFLEEVASTGLMMKQAAAGSVLAQGLVKETSAWRPVLGFSGEAIGMQSFEFEKSGGGLLLSGHGDLMLRSFQACFASEEAATSVMVLGLVKTGAMPMTEAVQEHHLSRAQARLETLGQPSSDENFDLPLPAAAE